MYMCPSHISSFLNRYLARYGTRTYVISNSNFATLPPSYPRNPSQDQTETGSNVGPMSCVWRLRFTRLVIVPKCGGVGAGVNSPAWFFVSYLLFFTVYEQDRVGMEGRMLRSDHLPRAAGMRW